jgi:hypothetical protein
MIFWSLIHLSLICFVFWEITKILPSIQNNFLILIVLGIAEVVLLFIFIKILTMYLNFVQGDAGEVGVKNVLSNLKDFRHLKDIMLPGNKGNVDLVVIGPTGAWTIEAKNPRKKVVVHDKYLDKEINQALAEKISLENFFIEQNISTPVSAALVFASKKARLDFGMTPIRGVYIIGINWLEKLLASRSKGYLDEQNQNLIFEKLKNFSSKVN